MNFPLQLTFKIMALAPQVSVTDASGQLQLYVKQKLFKLKEQVTVFEDVEQTRPLYYINADRVIDFSARYHFTGRLDDRLGSVKRVGMRSIWKVNYEIFDADDTHILSINEENPWVKVIDSLLGEVPLLGMFTGYFFNPSYAVTRTDGTRVLRLVKQPAMLEGKFTIEEEAQLDEREENLAILSLLMMTLLERAKG